jgi:hypothetical protein
MRLPRDYEWMTFTSALELSLAWSLASFMLTLDESSDLSPIRVVLLLPAYALYAGGTAIGSNGPAVLWAALLAAIGLVPAFLVAAVVVYVSRR